VQQNAVSRPSPECSLIFFARSERKLEAETPIYMVRRAEGPRKLRNRLPKYKTMHIKPITLMKAHRDTNKKQTVRAKN